MDLFSNWHFNLNYFFNCLNVLDDNLGDNRLLDDHWNRLLNDKWNRDFSVFDSNLVNLHDFLNNSISENFNRYLPQNLNRDRSLDFNLHNSISFDNDMNNLLSFNDFNLLDVLDNWDFDGYFHYLLYLSDDWNLSNYLHDLEDWCFNDHDLFDYSWHLHYLLDDSWHDYYFLDDSFNLDHPWDLYYLLNDTIDKYFFHSDHLFLHDNRDSFFNANLFDNLFSDWYELRNFDFDKLRLILNMWDINFRKQWDLFADIQRNNLIDLHLFSD
jgi:hypothetical protein